MKILAAIAAIIFLVGVGATAQMTNGLSDAEIQGRALAQQLCELRPNEMAIKAGTLNIRDSRGIRTNLSIGCTIQAGGAAWTIIYTTIPATNNWGEDFWIIHNRDGKNTFLHSAHLCSPTNNSTMTLKGLSEDQSSSFAGSDFWLVDLSMEFFHWPEQKALKKEVRRSRGCTVLESTNPNPSTNGYSRVVSWIDGETLGIVHAEAYDAQNKLLKEFDPKSFKKVNGQWELQEMEIRNVQTGSRSRIEFDLKED